MCLITLDAIMESVPRTRWNLTTKLIVAGLVIVGLGALLGSQFVEQDFWSSLLSDAASAFLITGVVSTVYEQFLRRDFISITDNNTQKILDKINLSEQGEELGLVEAVKDSTSYDFGDIIVESETLEILVNDGRTWCSVNSEDLRNRFSDPEKSTKIYLLHPDSEMISVMSRKTGTSEGALQDKIQETLDMLDRLSDENTDLEVYGHHLYNPYSLFVGDSFACLTTYFASRGRRSVPLLKFTKMEGDGFYDQLKDDLEDLSLDAESLTEDPNEEVDGTEDTA